MTALLAAAPLWTDKAMLAVAMIGVIGAWRAYFTRLYDTTPALRTVVKDFEGLLAAETLELFGLPPVSSSA